MHDAVNPTRQWAVVGNTQSVKTEIGNTIYFDGSDDALSHTGYPEIASNVGTFFVFCQSVGGSDSSGTVLFGTNTTASTYFQVMVVGGTSTGHLIGWSQESTQNLAQWFSTKNRSLVMTSAGTAASMRAYLDGVDAGLTWSGTPTAFAAGAKTFNAGRWAGGSSWDTQANVLVMGYSSNVWGPAQAMSFHLNPHQFFAPIERRIWVPQAAATGFKPAWARQNSRLLGGGV